MDDGDGRGWLPDSQLTRRELLALGVAPSQQALRKLLRAGDGVWWHLDRGHGDKRTIAISGLKAISVYVARTAQQKDILDTDRLPGRAVEVPVGSTIAVSTTTSCSATAIEFSSARRFSSITSPATD